MHHGFLSSSLIRHGRAVGANCQEFTVHVRCIIFLRAGGVTRPVIIIARSSCGPIRVHR